MKTYDDYLQEWEIFRRITKTRIDRDKYITIHFIADLIKAAYEKMTEADKKRMQECIQRALEKNGGLQEWHII